MDQTEHDLIVRTAQQVYEHERRLAAINGNLDRLEDSVSQVKDSVSGIKGRLAIGAAIATVATSGIVSLVVILVNRGLQ